MKLIELIDTVSLGQEITLCNKCDSKLSFSLDYVAKRLISEEAFESNVTRVTANGNRLCIYIDIGSEQDEA